MANYKIYTTITELMGPYVSKLILEFPFNVDYREISTDSFNVYVERIDPDTGDIVVSVPWGAPPEAGFETRGYQEPMKVYPCSSSGQRMPVSKYVAIEIKEEPLGKRVEGSLMTNKVIESRYRVTLLHGIGDDTMKTGLVFDNCVGEIRPQTEGWEIRTFEDSRLNYGFFRPANREKKPLIFWLHGAGEGGNDPWINILGCQCSFLSAPHIQGFFPNGAHVLAPQSPTVWMDDGVEKIGKSNESIYVEQLKECLDNYIYENRATIDTDRVYIGGLSNGGFMTMRMIFDYPDVFAAAIPICEVFYSENITDEMIEKIKDIPTWFVHCKRDELVPPMETSIPTYKRLKAAGAKNVHFGLYEYNADVTGKYNDELGRPMKFFNHGIWTYVLNNYCSTDLDGTKVMEDGVPVTIWEWVSRQSR